MALLTQPSRAKRKAGENMDWSAISGITASISAARDIAKGMSAARDSALINEKSAALMEQLLKAQEGLLAHNATLLQLQADLSKMQKENLDLKEALDERGKYTLVEIGSGFFALRSNGSSNHSVGASDPSIHEAAHYICQPCFSKGIKSVLQRRTRAIGLECTCCNATLHVDAAKLFPVTQ
jgi:hypothetical protein